MGQHKETGPITVDGYAEGMYAKFRHFVTPVLLIAPDWQPLPMTQTVGGIVAELPVRRSLTLLRSNCDARKDCVISKKVSIASRCIQRPVAGIVVHGHPGGILCSAPSTSNRGWTIDSVDPAYLPANSRGERSPRASNVPTTVACDVARASATMRSATTGFVPAIDR